MNGTLTARLLRSALAFLLCATMVGAAFAGSAGSISAQGAEAGQIPGFDTLPSEADLTAFASGAFDGEGIATLQVERIAVEPGAVLDLVAGPFIVVVEQGTLAFVDDLGLEAEISAGDSQYFAPGEGDSVINSGGETAIILRTSLITDAPINGDPGPEDGGDETDDADDAPVELQVTAVDITYLERNLQAPADTDFTITVTNEGAANHGFVIEDTEYETGILASGESETITVNLPAGEYTFFCPVPGHRAAGMEGRLTVSEDGGVTVDSGGDGADDSGTDDIGDDTADGDMLNLDVEAVDIAFAEADLEAPANTDFTITVTNNGVVKHGFVIEGTEFETSLIESGESETITVNLPAGEYTFFCPVPGHQQAGMEGTLIVSDDGSTTVSPDNDTDEPDNTGDEDGNGPGEDTPINPREDPADGSSPPTLGGVHALILQPTTAPDEVVISLTDAGFTPDTFDLARGGTLVIENAGETGCEVTFTDLDVSVELDAGDIEQVTLDIPAGAYDLACIAQGDEVLGEAVVTIVEETAQDEPIDTATPDPAADATPTPDDTAEPVNDETTDAAPMGVLLQTSITLGGASELFAATLTLQPGGVLSLRGADGMLGMMVTGGDLTVVRPGRAAAVLRDGRHAILPSGTIAEMTNNGDAPLTVLIAGVTGSSAAPDSEATNTPVSDDSGDDDASSDDTGSTDTGSASLDHYAFFPDDSELAELGLYPTWVAYTEISDPASNTFWFSGENSEASLTDWGWIRSSELRYSSEGEVTEYGEVSVMGILVDSFEDEDGAASFYAYIAEDTTGEPVDFLDGIDEVEDAIAFTFSGAESDTMIVAIHTGTYVITLFAAGPGIDAEALLDDVASLVFGVVGKRS